ncbi:MAG: carbon-phosphorus lyase complex subunit PhnI, partial [Actinomycetota bacterium]
SELEQSILMTTDGLDATGFLEHLKLPHYVTFRSMVDRKLAVRAARSSQSTPDDDATTRNRTDGDDTANDPVPVDPREGDCA